MWTRRIELSTDLSTGMKKRTSAGLKHEKARKQAWNEANGSYHTQWARLHQGYRRTYNRLQMRRARLDAGLVRKPKLGRGGHAWKASQRFHLRMVNWAKKYSPDILRLLG